MSRLIKKALNDVLKDSFHKDLHPEEHPMSDDKLELNIPHNPSLPEPPTDAEDVEKEHGVEDDGMGVDGTELDEGLLDDISSLQVLYQQIKFFHWVATGDNYIEIHRFFDEVAEALSEQVDLLAERLVFLGLTPIAEMKEIVDRSYVEFVQMDNEFKFDGAISLIDESLGQVISKMKDNSAKAGDSKDIGTDKMLQDFVYDLEVLQHHIRSFKG